MRITSPLRSIYATTPPTSIITGTGVTQLVEYGPGKVPTGLAKRIDGKRAGARAAMYDPATLDDVLKLVTA